MSKEAPKKIQIFFKPVLVSQKQMKLFKKRASCHDKITSYMDSDYHEYTFVPDGWCQETERACRRLSGLFDGITLWGLVEETYDKHIEYYNVMFNQNYVEIIGNRESIVGAKVKEDYRILYGKDYIIYGLQSIVKPFDFIIYNRAYSPNDNAYKDYKLALLTKEDKQSKTSNSSNANRIPKSVDNLPF